MLQFLLIALCATNLLAASPESKSQKEVLAAMDAWKQAMIQRDRSVLESLYEFGLVYSHSSGKHENKAEAIEAVVNGKDRMESIEFVDTSVSIYGNTALVQCRMTLRMTSDGQPNVLNLDVLHAWIKSGSRWRMAARHAARLNP
jgi:ketosteroid isomerase-like protein